MKLEINLNSDLKPLEAFMDSMMYYIFGDINWKNDPDLVDCYKSYIDSLFKTLKCYETKKLDKFIRFVKKTCKKGNTQRIDDSSDDWCYGTFYYLKKFKLI